MFPATFRALIALLLLAGAARAQPPAYKIETTDRQKVNATITYELNTRTFAVTKWMIFLPEPPELPCQGGVKVTADPVGTIVAEKSPLARKVRYIEIPVGNPTPGAGVTMKLEVEAVLRSRKLVELKADEKPPAVAPLTAAERKAYLAPTTRVDHDAKAFQGWLDAQQLRRNAAEMPLDFAARVLEVLRTDFRYFYDPDADKRASVACRAKATDCGGLGYLFIGALRANDVPARLLVGRHTLPRKPGSTPADTGYDRPHVRTEMFVAEIGWVPVDPASANAVKNRPVRDFLGRDPGDLLVLHVDADLQLPFPEKVRESQLLQVGPYFWTTGRGTYDASFGPTGWELKTTPLEKK
jgi:transglutaminase-like putative cysteine protease